jgi:hypothetical protein
MVYYFALLVLIISVFFECFFGIKKNDIKMVYLIAYFGILLLLSGISGFRFKTGLDQNSYIDRFNNCLNNPGSYYGEYGYLLLNIVFKKLFNNYFIMQIFISFFCIFSIGIFLYKYSDKPYLSLLYYYSNYFFPFNMVAMRIGIAFSIICIGYKYLEKKKFIKYLLVVITASQFHATAIIMILACFIYRKYNKHIIVSIYIFSLFVAFEGADIVWRILETISKLSFLPTRIEYLLSLYLNNSGIDSSQSFAGPRFLLSCLLTALLIFFHIKIKKNRFIFGITIGFFVSTIGFNFAILGRLASYFYVSAGGLIAFNQLIYERSFYKHIQSLKVVMLLFFILFCSFNMHYYISGKNYLFYFPYRSILF